LKKKKIGNQAGDGNEGCESTLVNHGGRKKENEQKDRRKGIRTMGSEVYPYTIVHANL
jgi:hypothetical protein